MQLNLYISFYNPFTNDLSQICLGESNANCELAALFPILSPQPNQDSETSPSPDSRTNSDGASSQVGIYICLSFYVFLSKYI